MVDPVERFSPGASYPLGLAKWGQLEAILGGQAQVPERNNGKWPKKEKKKRWSLFGAHVEEFTDNVNFNGPQLDGPGG